MNPDVATMDDIKRETHFEQAPFWLGITLREAGDHAWWIAYGFESWSVGAVPYCVPRPASDGGHRGGRRARILGLMALIAGRIGRTARSARPARVHRCAA